LIIVYKNFKNKR